MKKYLRRYLRNFLGKYAKMAVEKHATRTIAVMGDKETSIGREMIYQLLKENFPVRRNLESPYSELSVPLTILGYEKYPKSYFQWLLIIIRTIISLNSNHPYKHFLVLEMSATKRESFDYWMEITKPEVALIVGNLPFDYSVYGIKKIIKITTFSLTDMITPFSMALRQIGRYFNIDSERIDQVESNFNYPDGKIRIVPGINNSLIYDSTYYHLPGSFESVYETVIDPLNKIIVFSKDKTDQNFISKLKDKSIILNPGNYTPEQNDSIIIRGNRLEMYPLLEKLSDQNKAVI